MFKRRELAVGLELLDGLFHLRRAPPKVRRSHNHNRVVKTRAVFKELRLEDVVTGGMWFLRASETLAPTICTTYTFYTMPNNSTVELTVEIYEFSEMVFTTSSLTL